MNHGYLSTQKLKFTEPKEPKAPHFMELEEKKLDSGIMKMNATDKRAEKAMNEARKKAELVNFEDRLTGRAKEYARQKRLNSFKYKH